MSKFFMYGTSLEEIEQLMMQAPNFSLRRNGIVINNYCNCEGSDTKCNCMKRLIGLVAIQIFVSTLKKERQMRSNIKS